MTNIVIEGGHRLDVTTMSVVPNDRLVISEGLIVEEGGQIPEGAQTVDASGQFLMPGFIDAHVHFRLATLDFRRMAQWTEVQFGIAMAQLVEATLKRGFTTVRDTGGDLTGLMRAIKSGMVSGPRIVQSNRFISQTGGHGDVDGGARSVPDCACQMLHSAFGIVADGPDAVRKAARHVLREGADFLKIHVSGGVATPSDPLDCTQYTAEEIQAVVQEARNRKTYVTAHAYTPEAIQLAVTQGVRCIEHGNLLDAPTARLLAETGAYLVPTLVTYKGMAEDGRRLGLPERNLIKNEQVLNAGLDALKHADAAGVMIGWGTDLIGESQIRQRQEFAIRAEVQSPEAILDAMFRVNPQLLGLQGQIGCLDPGHVGDVVIVRYHPLESIALLAEDDAVTRVIQGGRFID